MFWSFIWSFDIGICDHVFDLKNPDFRFRIYELLRPFYGCLAFRSSNNISEHSGRLIVPGLELIVYTKRSLLLKQSSLKQWSLKNTLFLFFSKRLVNTPSASCQFVLVRIRFFYWNSLLPSSSLLKQPSALRKQNNNRARRPLFRSYLKSDHCFSCVFVLFQRVYPLQNRPRE